MIFWSLTYKIRLLAVQNPRWGVLATGYTGMRPGSFAAQAASQATMVASSLRSLTAYSNGDLYDNNNKYYYGLYWEEEGNSKVSFNEGFYVTKENAIKFLEEKTEEIGFTRRESNEFIMYWLPILEKNEKNLIYFELTEERNNFNRLYINPNPDSILRVAIHVKKVNNMVKVKEQKLTKFNRKGFTVVEWGGVEH